MGRRLWHATKFNIPVRCALRNLSEQEIYVVCQGLITLFTRASHFILYNRLVLQTCVGPLVFEA